jgi:hypothetical protein
LSRLYTDNRRDPSIPDFIPIFAQTVSPPRCRPSSSSRRPHPRRPTTSQLGLALMTMLTMSPRCPRPKRCRSDVTGYPDIHHEVRARAQRRLSTTLIPTLAPSLDSAQGDARPT